LRNVACGAVRYVTFLTLLTRFSCVTTARIGLRMSVGVSVALDETATLCLSTSLSCSLVGCDSEVDYNYNRPTTWKTHHLRCWRNCDTTAKQRKCFFYFSCKTFSVNFTDNNNNKAVLSKEIWVCLDSGSSLNFFWSFVFVQW